MRLVVSVLQLAAVVLVVVGVGMMFVPAGVVTAGVACGALAVVHDPDRRAS